MKNKDTEAYVAVDVGGTNIKYGLLDREGTILDHGEFPTPDHDLEAFTEMIVRICQLYKDRNLQGLAMAAPGRIDPETGYFHTGGAIGCLYDVDLKPVLEKKTGLRFTVLNDAKAAAAAELWKGSLRNRGSGVVMTIGTGIGGAIVLDGKIVFGHSQAAVEFSGIPVNWNSRVAGDENAWYMLNNTQSMLDRYAVRRGREAGSVDGREFFETVNAGDEEAIRELDWFCETLATGILALQQILDVEHYSIGGGISRQPVLIDHLQSALDDLFARVGRVHPAIQPEISACTYSNDANLIGALAWHLGKSGE